MATHWKHTPCSGLLSRFGTPHLVVLHRVHSITLWRLATTPPPSPLPHTGIFVSYHRRFKRCGSSPVPAQQTSERPVAASSTPGAHGNNACQPPLRKGHSCC